MNVLPWLIITTGGPTLMLTGILHLSVSVAFTIMGALQTGTPACADLNPVYRRLLRMALEELRLIGARKLCEKPRAPLAGSQEAADTGQLRPRSSHEHETLGPDRPDLSSRADVRMASHR